MGAVERISSTSPTVLSETPGVAGRVPGKDAPWTLPVSLRRDPRLIAIGFVTLLLGVAVASQADRPAGFTTADVRTASGSTFSAIPLGQHNGRSVFLDSADLSPSGLVELGPSDLRRVDITRTGVQGPVDHRSLGRPALDWASSPSWSIPD